MQRSKLHKRLGEILVENGLITQEQLESSLATQGHTKEFLGAILLRCGYVKEKDFLKALSEQFGIPLLTLKDRYIDWDLVKQFSASLILDYKCFPVEKGDYTITFAITNPLDVMTASKAEEESAGLKVKFALVSSQDMEDAVKRYKKHI